MADFPNKLEYKLQKRVESSALRQLDQKKDLVDFSSNDYLGFSNQASIRKLAKAMLENDAVANGAKGSRLLSGNHEMYMVLETFLAKFHGIEAALLFNSGYDANIGFFSSVPQRNDIVFYDELCHASIRDGIKLGNAKSLKFKHNDLLDLETKLLSFRAESRNLKNEIYVVTESVFSMDGDSPDLKKLTAFCNKNKFHLVVDEAHATGIFGDGKGLVNQLGLEEKIFARLVTFGKAMGCHGAAWFGSKKLKSYLVNFARSVMYTTALPPHAVSSILASYELLQNEVGRKQRDVLKNNIDFFRNMVTQTGLNRYFGESYSAIQACIISGNEKTRNLSEVLEKEGFDVRPILSPTVPRGKEQLRFCLHAFNTKREIEQVLRLVKENIV